MENQKLTQEELQQLTDLQSKNSALVAELGEIEVIRMNLDARRASAEQFLAELREEETKIGNDLNEKYGNGSINITTGEFISAPTQEEAAE